MQKDIQEKGQDLEFLAGKIQQAQEETAAQVFTDTACNAKNYWRVNCC